MIASWHSVELLSFNSWSPGGHDDYSRVKHIYMCCNGKNLWKYLQEITDPQKFKFTYTYKVIFICRIKLLSHGPGDVGATIKKSNFACVYPIWLRWGMWPLGLLFIIMVILMGYIHEMWIPDLEVYVRSSSQKSPVCKQGPSLSLFAVDTVQYVLENVMFKIKWTWQTLDRVCLCSEWTCTSKK
jgi:hypothetical protein